MLCAQGVDINHRDDKGNTALIGGVFYYPILDCLLKLGAKAHYRNHKKESSLFYACQNRKNTSMKRLCESDNSWMHIQRCLIELKNVSSSNVDLGISILEKMKFELPKIELKNKLNDDLVSKERTKSLKI